LTMDQMYLSATLRNQIKDCKFNYVEYTVCAVMRGKASGANITFGVPVDAYESLTGRYPVRNQLKVYMDKDADFDTVQDAEGFIRKALIYTSGWQVDPTGNYLKTSIANENNDRLLIYTLSTLLLLLSPIVWLFSQILYYKKRKGEFHVLLAIGAKEKSIAKLHYITGGILSCIAFMMTILLSSLFNGIVFIMMNTILPQFGLIESVKYRYELSLPALIASVVVSVVCGFLSCLIPYLFFKKEKTKGTIDVE